MYAHGYVGAIGAAARLVDEPEPDELGDDDLLELLSEDELNDDELLELLSEDELNDDEPVEDPELGPELVGQQQSPWFAF